MSSALSTGKGDRVGKKRRQKGRGKRESWETGLNAGLLNESAERRGGGPAASLIVTQTPSQPWEHARIPRSLHLSMLPSKWRNTATLKMKIDNTDYPVTEQGNIRYWHSRGCDFDTYHTYFSSVAEHARFHLWQKLLWAPASSRSRTPPFIHRDLKLQLAGSKYSADSVPGPDSTGHPQRVFVPDPNLPRHAGQMALLL